MADALCEVSSRGPSCARLQDGLCSSASPCARPASPWEPGASSLTLGARCVQPHPGSPVPPAVFLCQDLPRHLHGGRRSPPLGPAPGHRDVPAPARVSVLSSECRCSCPARSARLTGSSTAWQAPPPGAASGHPGVLPQRAPMRAREAGGGGSLARRLRGEKALDAPKGLGRTSLTPQWSSFFPFNPRVLLLLLQVNH